MAREESSEPRPPASSSGQGLALVAHPITTSVSCNTNTLPYKVTCYNRLRVLLPARNKSGSDGKFLLMMWWKVRNNFLDGFVILFWRSSNPSPPPPLPPLTAYASIRDELSKGFPLFFCFSTFPKETSVCRWRSLRGTCSKRIQLVGKDSQVLAPSNFADSFKQYHRWFQSSKYYEGSNFVQVIASAITQSGDSVCLKLLNFRRFMALLRSIKSLWLQAINNVNDVSVARGSSCGTCYEQALRS